MRAFLTGSYAYGTPHGDSDVDVAVLVEGGVLEALGDGEQYGASTSVRFGRLNLLLFRDERVFVAWRTATRNLERRRPVTRAEAVATIKEEVARA